MKITDCLQSLLTYDQGRVFASRELEEQHIPRQVVFLPSLVMPQQEGSSKASALQRVGDGSSDESGKNECFKTYDIIKVHMMNGFKLKASSYLSYQY